jgi:ATP-dependent helicase/nuclease subunit A
MSATPSQLAAIEAEGNVLVAAGAGAGKTSTLVERCVQRVLDPKWRASLDQILMVTFTEASAAEMRRRIRERLEKALAEHAGDAAHIEEQIALTDSASIGTLHSFCFKLVRRHFHELELDPQLTVLDEAQAAVLMDETLDEIFRQHYAGETKFGPAVEQVIQTHAGGREEPVRELILKVHHFTQTQPNPSAWLESQLAAARDADGCAWRGCLIEALRAWRQQWLGALKLQPADNTAAHEVAVQLERLGDAAVVEDFVAVLEKIPDASLLKPKHRKPAGFFDDAKFLRCVTVKKNGVDPLAQDWEWARAGMETLLELAQQFASAFAAAKREQAAVDFHDLEQFALRLLWDAKGETATALGREYRARFRYVFVDECQDINAAQDAILRAVGGTDADPHGPNRFLVGDVKQSIYRFRLADPRIFQGYEKRWSNGDGGKVIALNDNFRSRAALLDFFNAVFSDLMRPEIGRVKFDDEARLRFGAPEKRRVLSREAGSGPRVHLHLRVTSPSSKNPDEWENASEFAELTASEHEARLVANRLRELVGQKHQVSDGESQRDVRWGDMAILLRSPRNKAEVYAREFARQGIPLEVAQNDFFEALEITDLLSLLMLLDNPLQDVPLLAVLHSPLVSLTPGDLAEVRLANRGSYFWTALNRFHAVGPGSPAWKKVDQFLERFSRWRRMARDASLAHRLETILAETHYLDWLAANALNAQRAAQCTANVRRLLTLAQQFDPFQRQGVQRFLKFVEAQREVAGKEPISGSSAAVQLISIHRSKGLEYPVVVVPDLGKRFNFDDLNGNILLHERLGLCPRIKPPQIGRAYPSLTHWLYGKQERPELLGEEMRLLYVAMTRARDTLLLVGTVSRKQLEEKWPESNGAPEELLAANSMLQWLGPWLARHAGAEWPAQNSGTTELFSWRFYSEPETGVVSENESRPAAVANFDGSLSVSPELSAWEYSADSATREAAKTSVSALRRKMLAPAEEARPWSRLEIPRDRDDGKLSAAETGTAHHTLLEFAQLEALVTEAGVTAEAQRLVDVGVLSSEEAQAIRCDRIASFWSSNVGTQLLARSGALRRELPFTARFTFPELQEIGLANSSLPENEFVVIQGVADVVVILPEEIWLLDFKTDDVPPAALDDKVRLYLPQMGAYAAALKKTYRREVTKRWLHFLAVDQTIPMPHMANPRANVCQKIGCRVAAKGLSSSV